MQTRDTYTFETFIPENNLFAWNVLQKISHEPGAYTPVCLYGDSGTGKTHLLQAVYNVIRAESPRIKVSYLSCEEFLNGFIEVIRDKNGITPRQYKRSSKIWIV